MKRRDDERRQIGQQSDKEKANNEDNQEIDGHQLWISRQKFAQQELDKIHQYLVHPDWKIYTTRYAQNNDDKEQKDNNDLVLDYIIQGADEKVNGDIDINKEKYITQIDANQNNYGFGVTHEYHHLNYQFNSIKDELQQNNLYNIDRTAFNNLLIKSIEYYQSAKNKYKAKYFDPNYNILRNENISLRHVFAIIAYTDNSKLCTAFRTTYRTIEKETKDSQVTERHKQYYHWARALLLSTYIYFLFDHINILINMFLL